MNTRVYSWNPNIKTHVMYELSINLIGFYIWCIEKDSILDAHASISSI